MGHTDETYEICYKMKNLKSRVIRKQMFVKIHAKIVRKRKTTSYIWVEVFKNGLSKICGRQPLKNLK